MKTLKHIILSPYILSLLPCAIIILLIHGNFNKYHFEVVSTFDLREDSYIWFDDIDNDGTSEEFHITNQQSTAALTINDENGIIDQWNFRGKFNSSFIEQPFFSGDYNNNGQKEFCFITISSDSLFLHIISDIADPLPIVKNRFIAVTGKGMESPDPFIIPAEMDDLDGNGTKELIFGIGSGFSRFPRNVFAYYVAEDSLVMSPESGYYIWRIMQTDITGDGRKEIIPYGYATSNISPDEARYHDCSALFMVLDQNLRFLFEPLPMGGKFSKITPFELGLPETKSIGFLFNTPSPKEFSTVYLASYDGKITKQIPLGFHAVNILKANYRKKRSYLMDLTGIGIGIFDENFKNLKLLSCDDRHKIIQEDFDSDGADEIMVLLYSKNEILITREGLSDPESISFPLSEKGGNLISIKYFAGSVPEISLQSGVKHYMLRYGKNPSFNFFLLICAVIYAGILSFAMVIRKIQKDQLKKRYENEKKISQLQMALIMNQLDPHFTFNVINSIIYSVENSEKEKAGDQLRQFASLYRNLLLSAGSNQRTIREELDFCTSYITLQQNRYCENFSYNISVDDKVDLEILIPKMLIHVHVENAINHGLSPLKSGGFLEVILKREENILVIEVTDNGIGREQSANQHQRSTGKGLKIMDELYWIYNKLYDEKISSGVQDLFDAEGHPAGTRVIIKISNQNE